MQIGKLLELNFAGNANGAALVLKEPAGLVQSKRLRIKHIIKSFYCDNRTVVSKAVASDMAIPTWAQYHVLMFDQLIPKDSFGWSNHGHVSNVPTYFQLIINGNIFFNPDSVGVNRVHVIDDVMNVDLDTDTIDKLEVKISARHFINITTGYASFSPDCTVKLICEVLG